MATANAAAPPGYSPNSEERSWLTRINDMYDRGYRDRQTQEGSWFLSSAYYRGNQSSVWNEADQRLLTPPGPRRRREIINWFQRKVLARRRLFTRDKGRPHVLPATSDIDDKLNARLSTQALYYQHRRLHLERLYDEAMMWSLLASHGYWWFHWRPDISVKVAEPNSMTGESSIVDAPVGDVVVEVGSPFEVLVDDPAIPYIGDQPRILRVKLRNLEDIKKQYSSKAALLQADAVEEESQRQARYIAGLASGGWSTAVSGTYSRSYARGTAGERDFSDKILVYEYFESPTAKYPKGVYAIKASGVLLHVQEELPEGFHDMANPYPCVDFVDTFHPGQYWGSTVSEQLIGIQQSYNRARTAIDKHLRRMQFPKILVARQHKIQNAQWTDTEAEIVDYNWIPGFPLPQPWVPPPMSADMWRTLDLLREERDIVSGISVETEGQQGKAESGFQTQLLQEASASVHAPDIECHQRAKVDAYFKLRRMMKLHYTVDRFISVVGRNNEPDAFVFGQDNIDDHADIIIESSSALPDSKSARIQAVLEMWNAKLLGDPADPEVQRRAMTLIDMPTHESLFETARIDEDRARVENLRLADGALIPPALFCDDHNIHVQIHADDLKRSQSKQEDQALIQNRIAHILSHVRYLNPQAAQDIAAEYGLPVPPPPGTPPGTPAQPAPAMTPPAPTQEPPVPPGPPSSSPLPAPPEMSTPPVM